MLLILQSILGKTALKHWKRAKISNLTCGWYQEMTMMRKTVGNAKSVMGQTQKVWRFGSEKFGWLSEPLNLKYCPGKLRCRFPFGERDKPAAKFRSRPKSAQGFRVFRSVGFDAGPSPKNRFMVWLHVAFSHTKGYWLKCLILAMLYPSCISYFLVYAKFQEISASKMRERIQMGCEERRTLDF